MRLTYLDILEQCFHDKFLGYNKQEVDTFLRLIADDFKSMAEEIKDKDSEIKNLLSALKSQPAEKDTSIALEKAKKIVNAAKNQAEQHRKESMKELEQLIQDIDELKKLAGINEPKEESTSAGENLSLIGTKKSQYQRKHNIQPGTDEWFKLWFARPKLTGEDPMPKSK